MALEAYRKKRDFKRTSEPRGGKRGKGGYSFAVQKHAATRLHYDFRLELDGVLKSWAVTRGPSLVPGEKRLAVHVEDHPVEYGDFEGTIPKGEYGGGTVLLWDRGSWSPLHDPHKGFKKGHLEFELDGEKLSGRWHLIRMAGRPREGRENWLLIKGDDDEARSPSDPDILEERPESVATGRALEEIAGEAPGWSSKTGRIKPKAAARKNSGKVSAPDKKVVRSGKAEVEIAAIKGATKANLPDFVEPELATLVASAPKGDRWLHEIKFDGYRLQARVSSGKVKLLTRSGLDWTGKFGNSIADALISLPVKDALIDGELVVETASGVSDFSALQADLSAGRSDRFRYYAFDLIHLDGQDLRGVPLVERKAALSKLLSGGSDLVRYSDHFEESGELILQHACRLGLEGMVSKVRDGRYISGRSKEWLKSKCSSRQELVVAGYVPSTTSANTLGSLVLGVYEDGKLRHVGRVGTGFTVAVAKQLFDRFESMRIDKSPFTEKLTADEARHARFVPPELVAEVEFRAWTADGHLRHAAFRGLREDKPAGDIVREAPVINEKKATAPRPSVKLTHPDRVYWPDQGITKEGLANYHSDVWRFSAPFLVDRPLALLRCPTGIDGEKFFQKHAWRGINSKIVQVEDPKDKGEYLISIDSLDGLIGLVQSAVIEIHPWGSTLSDWERPDMIVMDLDPGDGVAWDAVAEAALEVKQRLEAAGLAAFLKTSGGKGLHVVSPLKPKADWLTAKAFTKAIAESMASDSPDRFVSTITKSKRTGKILIDYLRNQRGATAVAAYCPRARPGAAVSMPLAWDELGSISGADHFTIENAPNRLNALAHDPWEDFRKASKPLPAPKRQ
jgi:bifunctional non-homologous end joining protein LigD